MEIKQLVCENLKNARKSKGYSQKQLAYILGITQTVYSRYETCRLELDYAKIDELCKILDITPNDLFGYS